ncbi:hypothetical protein MEQU1_001039 [Malassezia equina]|uniref:GP-PDE domain-containing protein n=1 Tax=Malassezia equina TaxID=1381935 RepID=A0AAF0EC16_9BASI|nr:hypothetical protein MEQU1_001039 [Malassezia equina]
MSKTAPSIPDCWGHRGASAEFPENTLRSFAQAIKDGSEGIESDVHITADDVIVMFHDTTLDRTTNSKGLINSRRYYGEDGLEHVRTLKEPVQQIPTFKELCTLLMEPENRHVALNIDIKPNNDPERLFRIMGEVVHQFPNYEKDLAPRLILGLWHPRFIEPAKRYVPTLRRAHIGASPADALKYFWNDCDAFSIRFPSLVGAEGQAFLRKARENNKDVMCWTVNRKDEMVEATRYGVKAILTDYTADLHKLRDDMKGRSFTLTPVDYEAVRRKLVSPLFSWGSLRYYTPSVYAYQRACRYEVEHHAGESYDGAHLVK